MASGSFNVGTSNKYVLGTLSWSESNPNIAANTSDVYFELRFSRTNTGFTTNGSGDFTVWINGTPVSVTGKAFTYTYNSNTLVLSGTVTVPHTDNGSKQIEIAVDGNTNVHDVYYTTSYPWLDTIPRASTYTGTIDWTAGTDNLWMTIDRKSTDFHHSVQMFVQHTYDGNWDFIGQRDWVYDSGWWNPSVPEITQIYSTMSMYENRPCLMRVFTYDSAGRQIGDPQDKIGTVRAYKAGIAAFNDFNIGTTSVPATIQNYRPEFNYDVTLVFGSWTKNIGRVSSSSFNITFDDTEIDRMYQECTDANSKQGYVQVRTSYNGIYIEDGYPDPHDKYFIAYVVNQNPVFTTIEYHDTNTTITAVTENDQYIVQNKSTVQAKILNSNKAVGQKWATITKYVATLNGASVTVNSPFSTDIVFDFGVVNTTLNINLEITVYDSRGNTTKVTKLVNMVAYSNPVVQTQALRENGFGEEVTLTLAGSISPLNVNGVNKNSLVSSGVNYKWRELPSGAWSANIQFLNQVLTMPNYDTDDVLLTMATTSAFEIVVQVTDKLGNTTITLQVAVGTPIMMIDEILKMVGFGKFPDGDALVDVAGDIKAQGDLIANALTLFNGTTLLPIESNGSALLKSGVDFNTIKETGFHRVASSINAPPKSSVNPDTWFHLIVIKHLGINETIPWIIQVAWDFRDGVYHRRCWLNNGVETWDKWRRFTDDKRQLLQAGGGGQGMYYDTWYRAIWNTPNVDEGIIWNSGGNSNMFGVSEEGWYEINYSVYINMSVNKGFYCELWGDTEHPSILSTWTPSNGWNYMFGSNVMYLYPNKNYELVIRHTDDGYTRTIGEHRTTIKRL